MSASRSRRNPAPRNACVVVAEALEERHRIFKEQLVRVRTRPAEPAVHDLRVATRRLIAVIDLVTEIVEAPRLRKKRKSLRGFLKGLNSLRDVHIQVMALGDLRPAFPASGGVIRGLRLRERELLRSAARSVRMIQRDDLTAAIGETEDALLRVTMIAALSSATHAMVMGSLAAAFARVVGCRADLNGADPVTIHRMRVAFKKFRYTLEILAPLLPWMTPSFRKRLNSYQTSMGKVQDAVVVLGGITSYEAKRSVQGRMALLGLRQHLLSRRQQLMDAFLKNADTSLSFWR
jgi:CHAD domain-containing protein